MLMRCISVGVLSMPLKDDRTGFRGLLQCKTSHQSSSWPRGFQAAEFDTTRSDQASLSQRSTHTLAFVRYLVEVLI